MSEIVVCSDKRVCYRNSSPNCFSSSIKMRVLCKLLGMWKSLLSKICGHEFSSNEALLHDLYVLLNILWTWIWYSCCNWTQNTCSTLNRSNSSICGQSHTNARSPPQARVCLFTNNNSIFRTVNTDIQRLQRVELLKQILQTHNICHIYLLHRN